MEHVEITTGPPKLAVGWVVAKEDQKSYKAMTEAQRDRMEAAWRKLAAEHADICRPCGSFVHFPDETRVECKAKAEKSKGCACVQLSANGACPEKLW